MVRSLHFPRLSGPLSPKRFRKVIVIYHHGTLGFYFQSSIFLSDCYCIWMFPYVSPWQPSFVENIGKHHFQTHPKKSDWLCSGYPHGYPHWIAVMVLVKIVAFWRKSQAFPGHGASSMRHWWQCLESVDAVVWTKAIRGGAPPVMWTLVVYHPHEEAV